MTTGLVGHGTGAKLKHEADKMPAGGRGGPLPTLRLGTLTFEFHGTVTSRDIFFLGVVNL